MTTKPNDASAQNEFGMDKSKAINPERIHIRDMNYWPGHGTGTFWCTDALPTEYKFVEYLRCDSEELARLRRIVELAREYLSSVINNVDAMHNDQAKRVDEIETELHAILSPNSDATGGK